MALFGKKKLTTVKVRKRDMPDGLWIKCPGCDEMLFKQELETALNVCPKCGFHFQLPRAARIALLSDENSFAEWDIGLVSVDTLGFTGVSSYVAKIKENQAKTGCDDAISCGRVLINGRPAAPGVMDFEFLGASMGAVVGEKVTRLIERGTAEKLPVIISCASGGARMYEGLFSLMQMAKTSAALARHAEAKLPYITVLTHPTTAGVMASFATLGDIIMAEPGALIGFAGPRVIKETTQQELPEGFQRAEFLLKHGLLDMIVARKDLKSTLALVIDYMQPAPATA
ncbi:MAG: acetyl-CoA carboxylase, carboxyltransferase subunit beta [Kiritimatiellaeota bacterium]|nr:acetyl-CoA carboxylase, carboxyltransferase subunit beta [Kiritimatiellota bacterium]